MRIVNSTSVPAAAPNPRLASLIESVSDAQLRAWVERLAVPRHFTAEPEANLATAEWLAGVFQVFGFDSERQGPHGNVLACPRKGLTDAILVGAHYDSVPGCPGADDNASAVAALLGCAAACSRWDPDLPVLFAAFNREEDGLQGSRDFVESHLRQAAYRVRCAHILEMVGFSSAAAGSQRVPTGLPIQISDRGDFLGLLCNAHSGPAVDLIMRQAKSYVSELPVTGLEVELGFERVLPVLARSDHVPFWEEKIPAVMWTDTAEFRNPHYHQPSDRPETLDYGFLARVTRVLAATVIEQARSKPAG